MIGLFVKGARKPYKTFSSQAEAVALTGYSDSHISRCLATGSRYNINGVLWRYLKPSEVISDV